MYRWRKRKEAEEEGWEGRRGEEGAGETKGKRDRGGANRMDRMEGRWEPVGKTIRTALPSYVINATPSRDLLAECCAAKICNLLLPRRRAAT